jgi:hypothetical protein
MNMVVGEDWIYNPVPLFTYSVQCGEQIVPFAGKPAPVMMICIREI